MADTVTRATPVGIGAYLKAIYDNIPQVFAAGGKAWKRDFWNYYQNKGALADYSEAFSGNGWTVDYFTPQYDRSEERRVGKEC